jgi:hypothetical protein
VGAAALLPLLAATGLPAGAAPAPCPAPLVARQDTREPTDLSSQSGRFTPAIDRQLRAAFRLGPAPAAPG